MYITISVKYFDIFKILNLFKFLKINPNKLLMNHINILNWFYFLKELCKTLRLSEQDMDKIISLLPIEQKKKPVVMFHDDVRLMNLVELLSYFDTIGETVSIRMDKNVDELC